MSGLHCSYFIMTDLEIPIGKRTKQYRLFEMLPAFLSYGALTLLVLLSLISPIAAAIYLLLIIITMLVKAVGIATHTILGRSRMEKTQKIDWHSKLLDLENPKKSYQRLKNSENKEFLLPEHIENLRLLSSSVDNDEYPKPSELYNAVIIATYKESYEILSETIRSIIDTTYDNEKIILVLAREERGGKKSEATAKRLLKEFKNSFFAFHVVEHPKDLPNEVVGKGGNITYAGYFLKKWLKKKNILAKNVMVTTLDSDNRPFKSYFDYVIYEYIIHDDRKHLAYQPIALFFSNIWDVPAPMRVIAVGNSFWNIISSMRPHALRNFASHSQPMDALEEMNFWSTRTIVEDGHQFWRSFFHFGGNFSVLPLYVPIYQDAVLSDTYTKTLKAQFIQLRRWAYGASDIPYVATKIFSKNRNVSLFNGITKFIRLVDSHLTLASVSILVAVGGWVPLLINSEAARSIPAHQLPEVISTIQQIALIGLFITISLSIKMLPPRPECYKRTRTVSMILQWFLMPFTSILYGSVSALYSQGRLFSGKYLDKFDVTEKATRESISKTKSKN